MEERAGLEVRGLTKIYDDVPAVRDVSLRVRHGEIHGLLGPNGAGKTTLLRMLLGLVEPTSGRAFLLGNGAGTARGLARSGVAGVCDAPRFYPYLSARRNLTLLARLDGRVVGADVAERVAAALADVGLGGAADAKAGTCSAGMTARLGLASALLRAPRLLLLDEPTGALDPAAARDVRERLRRLAADGAAILLSSHDLHEVEALCSSVTIMSRSEVVFSGTIAALREQAPLIAHTLSTSDDAGARALAATQPTVVVGPPEGDAAAGAQLEISAEPEALDAYVLALGRAGIAVRSLERKERSLEALFLQRTEGAAARAVATSAHDPEPAAEAEDAELDLEGVRAVVEVELAKLSAQPRVWVTIGACLVGPFAFVAALSLQSALPDDTLFGRWAKTSGFAVPLVVLGFAAAWALPVLTCVVGGDLFASEDRHGTWKTLLTRSRTRADLFVGKIVVALAFSFAAVFVLAVASTTAGAVFVGMQPLLGLSGTMLSSHESLGLVLLAWASVLPPAFGFTALAVLASIATRSSAAGTGLPVLAALLMQLVAFVNGPDLVRRALLVSPFGAWHFLFTDPKASGPLLEGAAVSTTYFVLAITAAWLLFRRRETSR